MKTTNQSGIAHLALILGAIVILVAGAVGYFVINANKDKSKISNYQQCVDAGGYVLKSSPPQCVKNNKTYTRGETKVATKITNFDECVAAGNPVMESYPERCAAQGKTFTNTKQKVDETAGWSSYEVSEGKYSFKHPASWVLVDDDGCNPGLVLIGATESSVGRCGSGNFGQMNIYSYTDGDKSPELASPYYKDISRKSVTVDGVGGTREAGTATDKWEEGPIEGTKVVQYVFVVKGRYYIAQYYDSGNYPDVLSDFDTLITKTFKFN